MRAHILKALMAMTLVGIIGGCRDNTSTSAKAVVEPEWNGNVKDTDPCQPVREQKMGGVIVFCKGKCPAEGRTCGTLQSRKHNTENPWKNDDGSTYDSTLEYRCLCPR